MSYFELTAMLPREDHYLTGILIRPRGDDVFPWIGTGDVAQLRDHLVLYAIDKTDVDQLNAINIDVDSDYYPQQSGIRPDEQQLIETHFPSLGETSSRSAAARDGLRPTWCARATASPGSTSTSTRWRGSATRASST